MKYEIFTHKFVSIINLLLYIGPCSQWEFQRKPRYQWNFHIRNPYRVLVAPHFDNFIIWKYKTPLNSKSDLSRPVAVNWTIHLALTLIIILQTVTLSVVMQATTPNIADTT